jgi:hypothetical protein
MKRLVLFVEGDGDVDAVPLLVRRILREKLESESRALVVDSQPFRVSNLGRLKASDVRPSEDFGNWIRWLEAARKRSGLVLGGVLLLLDGDAGRFMGQDFCPAVVARLLADAARRAGAGAAFSVAVVFADQEYESWLLAAAESFRDRRLPDGRPLHVDVEVLAEVKIGRNPRDAKKWLSRIVEGGYKETRHQALLTKLIDLEVLRRKNLRSFVRLEKAIMELVAACRDDRHVSTPGSSTT